MKKIISVIITIALIGVLAGCTEEGNSDSKPMDSSGALEETLNKNQTDDKDSLDIPDGEKLKVAVTIVPQEGLIEAIAGDKVEVVTLVPPGASPTNYQPTPQQMQKFNEATVYFSIGVPTEAANIFPNMVDDREDLQVVRLNEIVAEVYPERSFADDEHHDHADEDDDHDHDEHADEDGDHDHDEHADEDDDHDHDEHADEDDDHDHDEHADEDDDHDDHDHSGKDPHVWMSPKRMILMAEETYEVLAELDPDNAELYSENVKAFIEELKALDALLLETLEDVPNKEFIITHPSMGYFADDYGLEMVSLEKDGKESTASHLQHVIDYAKEHDVKVVFFQAEFDSAQAKTLAEEIDGEVLELVVLAKDYLMNMKEIEQIFEETLR